MVYKYLNSIKLKRSRTLAIPPTKFTTLLYAEKTPAEMYERLKREDCLSDDGLNNKAEVISLISNVLKVWKEKDPNAPIIYGGGPVDDIADNLLRSNYLNENVHRLHRPHLYESETRSTPWWKFWQKF
jgi:hypothetical protein